MTRIAVTGAGGTIGGHVGELLAARGGHELVRLTRRVADYDDPEALVAALRGVDTLVFVSSDGESARVLVHHQNVLRAAADSGVGHVVALSGLDADVRSPFCYAFTYAQTERMLRATGCGFSIARASIYAEFFLRWPLRARATGQLRVPAGDARISLVTRADVARCLAALALGDPTGRHHDVTGPEALDLEAIAARCARAWGVPVAYVDPGPGEHLADMAAEGEDPWWMFAFASMFHSIRERRWATVSDEVRELTGRAPTPLDEVLQAQA